MASMLIRVEACVPIGGKSAQEFSSAIAQSLVHLQKPETCNTLDAFFLRIV
jgi:hypothetical protein